MKQAVWIGILIAFGSLSGWAAPYVAYVGNISVHSTSENARIIVVDLGTGNATDVSKGLFSARSPGWAQDGSRVAFQALDEGLCDIFVCGPDGSGRVNVTATADVWETSPCFAGPGRVVYLAGADRSDLWMADLASGEKTQLTRQPLFYGTPVGSPDGSLVAVAGSPKLAGPGDIYLISVADGTVTNVTQAPAVYSTPAFSPDGQVIAFAYDGRDIGGATRGVATLAIGGGEPTLLASDGYPLGALCFSPDGGRIAYTSSTCYHNTWVRVMNADGTENERITPSSAHIIGWPSFTSDGRGLVYQGVYGAKYTARLLDLESGKSKNLPPEGEGGVTPTCAPQ